MGRRSPKRNSSFFKVLIGDFADKLRIPPAFMKKNLIEKLPQNLTLKSHDGKSWVVKLEQISGYHYVTQYGWQKFVEDQKLEVGDFLVFFLISGSTFEVLMYDRTGCEKEVISPTETNIEDAPAISEQNNESPFMGTRRRGRKSKASVHVKMVNDESYEMVEAAAASFTGIQTSFAAVLKKYNKCYMIVPRDFARESGMKRKKSMVLRNTEGREWPVVIRVWKWRKYGRVVLSNGWSQFRKANNLIDGATYLFRLIQSDAGTGNVIQVQKLREKPTRNRYSLRSKKVPSPPS